MFCKFCNKKFHLRKAPEVYICLGRWNYIWVKYMYALDEIKLFSSINYFEVMEKIWDFQYSK